MRLISDIVEVTTSIPLCNWMWRGVSFVTFEVLLNPLGTGIGARESVVGLGVRDPGTRVRRSQHC